VATNIANVNTVAGNNTNVSTVASDITNVNTVASNIADVNNFSDTYRISATAPTTSLDIGDLWFDTVNGVMKVYSASGWITAASAVNGTAERFKYTATASQTTFSGTDDNNNILGYDAGFMDVYLNGIKLVSGASNDYVATNGTSIVLNSGAAANDILEAIAYGTFELLNSDVGDLGNVNTTGLATNDLLRYDGTNFVPKSFDEITPTQTSNAGKFLTTDGTNSSWGTVNTNLVADTTPQLGGNLDLNSNDITGTGNINITGNVSLSGTVDGRDVATDGTKLDTIATSATANPNAIDNLVEDTTPQLGADLDGNGNTIDLSGSTTELRLPRGTTAQQPTPSAANEGAIRYDTDNNVIYYSDGSSWLKIAAAIPTISSVSGTILETIQSTLTLTGTNFLTSNLVVTFTRSGTDYTQTVTPTSDTSATVTTPSGLNSVTSGGDIISIKVTNSDFATSNTQTVTVTALPSGGTISTSGNYRYHKFTSSGTFTNTISSLSVDYIIAAGGGGSTTYYAGGGGAGGFLAGSTTASAASHTITIGAGGAGVVGAFGSGSVGNNGGNSSALSITATGGGGGGSRSAGASGGSGGGGGNASTAGGSGTSGQGNAGGSGSGTGGASNISAGGGGGKGGAGTSGVFNSINGNGGVGTNSYSTWATATSSGASGYYAGGGGGGTVIGGSITVASTGGAGGGGTGGISSGAVHGTNGTANTGGGAGGGGENSGSLGASGGSGIVILRYDTTSL
jgi:hypothetical protein